jgi:hypothetical protein
MGVLDLTKKQSLERRREVSTARIESLNQTVDRMQRDINEILGFIKDEQEILKFTQRELDDIETQEFLDKAEQNRETIPGGQT